jgi:DNA-directed RNA polymerase
MSEMKTKFEAEIEWERLQIDEGAQKIQDAITRCMNSDRDVTLLSTEALLYRKSLANISKAIETKINNVVGRPSKLQMVLARLLQAYEHGSQNKIVDVSKMARQFAQIGLQHIFNAASRADAVSLQSICIKLGQKLITAVEDEQLAMLEPKLYDKIFQKYGSRNTFQFHKVLNGLKYRNGICFDDLRKDEEQLYHIGFFVASRIIVDTIIRFAKKEDPIKIFEFAYMKMDNHRKYNTLRTIRYTREAAERISDIIDAVIFATPSVKPMLIEPMKIADPTDTPFLLINKPFVRKRKSPKVTKLVRQLWVNPTAQNLYDAANYVSGIPIRVNPTMVSTFEKFIGTGLGGLAHNARVQLHMPEEPDTEDEQVLADYRAEISRLNKEYHDNLNRAGEEATRLKLAQQLTEVEQFYFGYHSDVRGRLYPHSQALHPQSSNDAKSMLEFYEGRPCGPDGILHLMLYAADVFDKCDGDYESQMDWSSDHMDEMLASADDPEENTFWLEADKPWLALRVCLELKAWELYGGQDFVSHLPIPQDATCSALQQYSAVMRDTKVAKLVNLTVSDEYHDAYLQLSERVQEKLRGYHTEMGDFLAEKLSRSVVKRNGMTKVYGLTPYGSVDQVVDALTKADRKLPFGEQYLEGKITNFEAARIIAPLSREALDEMLTAESELMDWLQETAKLFARAGVPLILKAPDGLPVPEVHYKPISKKRKVRTRYGQLNAPTEEMIPIDITLQEESDTLNANKMESSIAADFAHMLDATHLRKVIQVCEERGIPVIVVHDSISTLACCVMELRGIVWECFCEMHNSFDLYEDVYLHLKSQLPAEWQAKLKEPPERGDL